LVVVIAERVWRSRFDTDPHIVGREVELNGAPATVIGIASDASGFPSAAAVWLPLRWWPGLASAPRDARRLRVFGRLATSVTPNHAQADLEAIMRQLASEFPEAHRDVRLRVVPLYERFVSSRDGWWQFMTAGAIVVLIAALNVGNLLAVRSRRRAREFAIRTSLGATRRRLARQLLVESAALAAVGTAGGFAISRAGAWWHQRNIPEAALPYWTRFYVDSTVIWGVVFLMLVMLLAAAVVAVASASRVTPMDILKDGGRSTTSTSWRGRFASGALGLQIALAIVLMAQQGLATLDARLNAIATDAQLDDPGVLTASYGLSAARYVAPEAKRTFNERVLEGVNQLPGVRGAALTSDLPLAGATDQRLRVNGRPLADRADAPAIGVVAVTPAYFTVLGLTPIRGRTLADGDPSGPGFPVVVNERFATTFFPNGDALGTRIALDGPTGRGEEWSEVVGIVRDVRQHPTPETRPLVYVPLVTAPPTTVHLLARVPPNAMGPLRELFRRLDPALPLYEIQTLASSRRTLQWLPRMSERLALTVTIAAVLLAIAGLYTVVSYRTALRTQEIAIRMALGAKPRHVAALVAENVHLAVALGFMLGLFGVFGWTRAFAPTEMTTTAAVSRLAGAAIASLGLIVLCACVLPARRTMRLEPTEALRRES
jgi:predicted permease